MPIHDEPLVSVVTPVHNDEIFLGECIGSVLAQTYQNYEYIIVNNCSTDRTLEVASNYARKDSRIRIYNNGNVVGISENHNVAFNLVSPQAKYCKVVSAEDLLFPNCLTQMVTFAESHPSAVIVGSYQLSGKYVRWQGFPYPTSVFAGNELCRHILFLRQVFIDEQPMLGFGTPTSLLYRADIIRNSGDKFYPNSSPHADTSACFKYLHDRDFGFIHQVLTYGRIHENAPSAKSAQINRFLAEELDNLIQYGPLYLTKEELELKLKQCVNAYHQFLAVSYFTGIRDREFWEYHKEKLKELGYPLKKRMLLRAAVVKSFGEIVNPGQALSKVWKRASAGQRKVAGENARLSQAADELLTGGRQGSSRWQS